MKKAVTIFLLCLYTLAAFGATVNAHYCMGRLISLSLAPASQRICGNCGMPKERSHGCCHDEQRTLKMNADHKPAPAVVPGLSIFQPVVATEAFDLTKPVVYSSFIKQPASHAPPVYSPKKIYLQNGVLLI